MSEDYDENHPIYQAIDRGGGQTCDINGVVKELRAAGYVIVPREPTDAMVVEAMIQPYPTVEEAGGLIEQGREAVRVEWRAMVAAALQR